MTRQKISLVSAEIRRFQEKVREAVTGPTLSVNGPNEVANCPDEVAGGRVSILTEQRDYERARAERAEAELARYPTSAADARICKQQMIEQRARADRYLAAMVELVSALDGGLIEFAHTRECRYWRNGKSHGPCVCGAVTQRAGAVRAASDIRRIVEEGKK